MITFAPVPQGARWQVLVTQELSRLYRVTVDHDDLGIDHDPHDNTTLAETVRARALELFAHGNARAISGEQSVEVTSWEIESNRRATEALKFHTPHVDSHTDRAGAQAASPLANGIDTAPDVRDLTTRQAQPQCTPPVRPATSRPPALRGGMSLSTGPRRVRPDLKRRPRFRGRRARATHPGGVSRP